MRSDCIQSTDMSIACASLLLQKITRVKIRVEKYLSTFYLLPEKVLKGIESLNLIKDTACITQTGELFDNA